MGLFRKDLEKEKVLTADGLNWPIPYSAGPRRMERSREEGGLGPMDRGGEVTV